MKTILRKKMAAKSVPFIVFYASVTAFLTYSCMYAFRKPFTAASFDNIYFLSLHIKIWFVGAQVIGYTLSKFIGITYVSQLKPSGRASSILILIGLSQLGLLIVFLAPIPVKIAGMFINGLPLGIIWGLVFSYLEGRRTTEIMGAALSASFIIASGVVKSVGKFLTVSLNVNEFAMPFLTGLLFSIPLVIVVYLLDIVPPPDEEDVKERTIRLPMNKVQRWKFFNAFYTGIILFVISYTLLTVYREIRDNFSNEIWASIGYSSNPSIFTLSELPVAFFTLVSLALISFIRSNIKAFMVIQIVVVIGFCVILFSTLFYTYGLISGVVWMIGTGTGLYMGYVPFNALLYERLISAFKYKSNIGFVMYISDAFGYLGSVTVMFMKNFISPRVSWKSFFISSGYWVSLPGILFVILALIYFKKKYNKNKYEDKNIQHEFKSESISAAHSGALVNQ